MKIHPYKILCLLLCLGLSNQIWAQSLVDDANLSMNESSDSGVFSETIKIISSSKKIFILTNNNLQLGPGDFISLALNDKLAARALVAKVHQGQVGIKILKIYSLSQWSKLQRNLDVQIIKGDDSGFGKKAEVKTEESSNSKIKTEEDLFNGESVSEVDLEDLDEKASRHIKPDNIISLSGGFESASKTEQEGGGTVKTPALSISWAYQFTDNFFVEGLYSRAQFASFPADGTTTLINKLSARIKFNIKGPAYTFFMPYLGYYQNSVISPDAGNGSTNTAAENQAEIDAVNKLKTSGPAAGVTILRRLVPGWFIKADLGTDILNLGFSIEF